MGHRASAACRPNVVKLHTVFRVFWMPPRRPGAKTVLSKALELFRADFSHTQHDQSGGALLMTSAPRTANSSASTSSSSPSERQRQGDYTKPFTVNDGIDSAVLGEEGFKPFVQLASWGQGSFNPLAQFSSGGLLLGGGSEGGENDGAGSWSVPPAAGAAAVKAAAATRLHIQMENNTNYDRMNAIRTRHGGLEIAPAGGEWLYRTPKYLKYLISPERL